MKNGCWAARHAWVCRTLSRPRAVSPGDSASLSVSDTASLSGTDVSVRVRAQDGMGVDASEEGSGKEGDAAGASSKSESGSDEDAGAWGSDGGEGGGRRTRILGEGAAREEGNTGATGGAQSRPGFSDQPSVVTWLSLGVTRVVVSEKVTRGVREAVAALVGDVARLRALGAGEAQGGASRTGSRGGSAGPASSWLSREAMMLSDRDDLTLRGASTVLPSFQTRTGRYLSASSLLASQVRDMLLSGMLLELRRLTTCCCVGTHSHTACMPGTTCTCGVRRNTRAMRATDPQCMALTGPA